MTTATEKITPAEWRVTGQLRHNGVTYGPNEPLPELTMEQAATYVAQGVLWRVGSDQLQQDFLDGTDVMILQRILDENPGKEFLESLLELVRFNRRSQVLDLALQIAMKYKTELTVTLDKTQVDDIDQTASRRARGAARPPR